VQARVAMQTIGIVSARVKLGMNLGALRSSAAALVAGCSVAEQRRFEVSV